jgi:anti-sigma factor RsiW
MKCEDFNACLSAYVDNRLNARENSELEGHVSTCRRCSEDLKEFQQLRSILRSLPAPEPREGFWDESLRVVRLSAASGKKRMQQMGWPQPDSRRTCHGVTAKPRLRTA